MDEVPTGKAPAKLLGVKRERKAEVGLHGFRVEKGA